MLRPHTAPARVEATPPQSFAAAAEQLAEDAPVASTPWARYTAHRPTLPSTLRTSSVTTDADSDTDEDEKAAFPPSHSPPLPLRLRALLPPSSPADHLGARGTPPTSSRGGASPPASRPGAPRQTGDSSQGRVGLASQRPSLAERRLGRGMVATMPAGPGARPPMGARQNTTPDLRQRAGLDPMSSTTPEGVRSPPARSVPQLLGYRTRYKPLYLLALGAAGNWLYGTGTVALERGLYARRPVAPPDSPLDLLPSEFQPLFGSRSASLAVGGVSTAVGTVMALLSCLMFYGDARAQARKPRPEAPSYTRANVYFGVHLSAITLSVGAKFATEALRDLFSRETIWAALVPGQLGQALFAVTQAQAFSTSELFNGKMPLKHRGAISFAARCMFGTYNLYGVLQSIPYLSSYGKEVVRLSAVTAATLAFALPLTTARIERNAPTLPQEAVLGIRPQDSWHALKVLGLYFAGRLLSGFGPDAIQRGVHVGIISDQFSAIAQPVFGGAIMLALGTATSVVAIMLFRQDVAAYDRRKANIWAFLAVLGLLSLEAYRGIFELGLVEGDTQLAYLSAIPGAVGQGLLFAVLPELFCHSELLRGNLPLKQRYHWTETSRGLGSMLFGIWGSTCAIPGFNPFAREFLAVTASIFDTLGMALPTTTTRQAQPAYTWPLSPGATPGNVERGDPFALIGLAELTGGSPGGAGAHQARGAASAGR